MESSQKEGDEKIPTMEEYLKEVHEQLDIRVSRALRRVEPEVCMINARTFQCFRVTTRK